MDVIFTRSTDGRKTWSKGIQVGQASGVNFLPSIAVAPDGTVGISYLTDFYANPPGMLNWVLSTFSDGKPATQSNFLRRPCLSPC